MEDENEPPTAELTGRAHVGFIPSSVDANTPVFTTEALGAVAKARVVITVPTLMMWGSDRKDPSVVKLLLDCVGIARSSGVTNGTMDETDQVPGMGNSFRLLSTG